MATKRGHGAQRAMLLNLNPTSQTSPKEPIIVAKQLLFEDQARAKMLKGSRNWPMRSR